MEDVISIKRGLSLANWKQLINDRMNSGLTIKKWCSLNGISENTYYYWLKAVRKEAAEQLPQSIESSLPVRRESDSITFKKLEVQSPVSGFRPAVLVHINGATVEVPNGADRETVEAVLLALKSVC